MSDKEKYIKYANNTFEGQAKEIVLNHIELFYDESIQIKKKHYNVGDDVFLKKGSFMHGIPDEPGFFEFIVENGFVSSDFSNTATGTNKIRNSIGMWNIKEDCYLKDYIVNYSGFTITYKIGRGHPSCCPIKSELIPYHKFDEFTERINDDPDIYLYWGDKTKEVTFLPSLVSNKRQIAFILNMESEYAKKIAYSDVWNTDFDEEVLKEFLDYRYFPEFIKLRFNKDASSTDRESSIMFGVPSKLIEGILVGRNTEKDDEKIKYIKSKLPDCYICNLDGKVIIGN